MREGVALSAMKCPVVSNAIVLVIVLTSPEDHSFVTFLYFLIRMPEIETRSDHKRLNLLLLILSFNLEKAREQLLVGHLTPIPEFHHTLLLNFI